MCCNLGLFLKTCFHINLCRIQSHVRPRQHIGVPKKWCFRLSGSDTPPVSRCKTFTKSECWGWIILRHPLTPSQPLQHKCPKDQATFVKVHPIMVDLTPIGLPLFRYFFESPRSFIMFYVPSSQKIHPPFFPRVTPPSQMATQVSFTSKGSTW